MKRADLTDSQIWNLLRKGDKTAFSVVYSAYFPELYYYGLKFTSDVTLVEDVLQDLFTGIFNNCRSLGQTDNVLFYLLKSFKRKLLRKMKTAHRFEYKTEADGYVFDVTWSVEHDLILDETSRRKSEILLSALKSLTPRQKEAVYLRFTKELDYKSIAEIMKISVEGCRNLISKAIHSMKKSMEEKGQNPLILWIAFSRSQVIR